MVIDEGQGILDGPDSYHPLLPPLDDGRLMGVREDGTGDRVKDRRAGLAQEVGFRKGVVEQT